MDSPEIYVHRCLELARLAAGHVAPNPMVGAVLVHEGRIIGEGYHMLYGQAHAEVNCIASVREEDRALIPHSTIYVSLEPCAHHGKTPPCADLIIREGIPRVVVGCRDPFPLVDGKGIEKLRAAGVSVEVGVLEAECIELNRRFFTFHTAHRPYIILKWAQSVNGKIGGQASDEPGAVSDELGDGDGESYDLRVRAEESDEPGDGDGESYELRAASYEKKGPKRVLISNEYTNRLVHKWRSEEASILVGTNTALLDDPALTVRLWKGPNPIRLVIDKDLRLPLSLRLFDGQVKTVVFNVSRHEEAGNVVYYQLSEDSNLVHQLVMALYQLKIQSVLVEGGATLLQSFIDEGYWDEARVITNDTLQIPVGVSSPVLKNALLTGQERLKSDVINFYRPGNMTGAGVLQ